MGLPRARQRPQEPHSRARVNGLLAGLAGGPRGRAAAGALPPDSLGSPSLCCLCSTHAHSRTHSCAHAHGHTHSCTHPHTQPADTSTHTYTEHTITHTRTLTPSYKYACILMPAQLKHTHTHMLTPICMHTLLHTHSCPRVYSHVPTCMHTHGTQFLSNGAQGWIH